MLPQRLKTPQNRSFMQRQSNSSINAPTSGTPGSILRTHFYSRFMQKPNASSLYNKNFGSLLSPRKTNSRITKSKSNRRRSLEVNKFSNIEQREQYRRLIEQYRSTTLKETSFIFGLRQKDVAPQTEKTPSNGQVVIDLTEESPNSKTEPGSKKCLFARESLKELDNVTTKPTVNGVKEAADSYSKPKKVDRVLEAQENDLLEKFSSPYLSKNFVPDLLKSYSRRERQRQVELCTAETRARQLREKRAAKETLLSEILHKKLQLKEKKEEKPELPLLTPEMNDAINAALTPFPPNEVLCSHFNIQMTREHLSTLFGLNWLNDEVINFYMELIVERSKERDDLPNVHAMNTFFYPRLSTQKYNSVRRWTKKTDIFAKDIILFPIHLGVHWCLAVADFMKKEIRYYDSMGGSNRECLQILKDYLKSEHENKKNLYLDLSGWQLLCMSSIPQQMNGSDCGVFTCKFAEYIANKSELTFDQSNMPYFRRAIVWEILSRKLLR